MHIVMYIRMIIMYVINLKLATIRSGYDGVNVLDEIGV
jgi:hypothetical protein